MYFRSITFIFLFSLNFPIYATSTPNSNEYVVNTLVAGWQGPSQTAVAPMGEYTIAWADQNIPASYDQYPIYMRRYNSQGQALDSGQFVDRGSINFAIERLSNGNTVLAISKNTGSGGDIYYYLYGQNGNLLRGPELVNSNTVGNQSVPAISRNLSGQFVIAWSGPQNIYYRRYDNQGNRLGTEIRANLSDGSFVSDVALMEDNQLVFAYVFGDSSGLVISRHFDKNDNGSREYIFSRGIKSSQNPRLALTTSGHYTIVWQAILNNKLAAFTATRDLAGNLLTPQTALTQDMRMNTQPDVVAHFTGFTAIWQQNDSSGTGIFMRDLDNNGMPIGQAQQVNQYVQSWQQSNSISSNGITQLVSSWSSMEVDGDGFGIAARNYSVNSGIQPLQIARSVNLPDLNSGWQYFKLIVPPNQNLLKVNLSGGGGNADIKVRQMGIPTDGLFDFQSSQAGNLEEIVINQPASGAWYIGVKATSAYNGVKLSTAIEAVPVTPVIWEKESNDYFAEANTVVNATDVLGLINSFSDRDYFKANVPANRVINITLDMPNADYDLYVYNSSRQLIATGYNGWGYDESVSIFVPTPGDIFVRIVRYSGLSSDPYVLRLNW